MDYVRSFGVPIPRVLPMRLVLRSSQSTYIIMENAQGIELGHVWDKITPELRDHTVREWVAIDRLQMQPIMEVFSIVAKFT